MKCVDCNAVFLPRVNMYVCIYYLETVKPAVPLLTTHWYIHILYYCFQYTSSRATLSTRHIMVKILNLNGCWQFFCCNILIFFTWLSKKYFFSNSFQFSSIVFLFKSVSNLKYIKLRKILETQIKTHWTNLFLYLESARFLSKCQMHMILFTYCFSNKNQLF